MIDFNDITYVRLGTRNLDQAIEYATRILGLQLVRHEGRSAYFRSDSRDHTLVYFEGDPRDHTTGFEVASSQALGRRRRSSSARAGRFSLERARNARPGTSTSSYASGT